MSVITEITPQIKDKERCNIFVDNSFYCGMELSTVILNKLKVGIAVDKAALSAMQLESEKSVALDKAMGFISRSMKTKKAVRRYLLEKGYLAEVADYAVEKLASYGYVNDEEYAAAYVRQYGKVKGTRLIKYELHLKGVSDSDMESALATIVDEVESATEIARKYLRNKDITDYKDKQKAYKYLLTKGFSYETAAAALKGAADECEDF